MNAISSYLDHTLLRSDATEHEVYTICQEAIQYQFAAVCIHPTWVKQANEWLRGTSPKLCSVVGFPLGANTTATKAFEANQLAGFGALELDMVVNLGFLKSKDFNKFKKDISEVVSSVPGIIVKAILETALLNDDEKKTAALLACEAGVHFVKTSTGFSKGGATVQDVSLLRKTVGSKAQVKASGGIRDLETALQMIEAGANRIGTSSSVHILEASLIMKDHS